jgi:hypothetical protein
MMALPEPVSEPQIDLTRAEYSESAAGLPGASLAAG